MLIYCIYGYNRLWETVACRPAGRPARPRTQHDCHHVTKVQVEAATAIIELLMMGGKRPKHVDL